MAPAGGAIVRRYRDNRTEWFAAGERVKAFAAIERQANLRLTFLEQAGTLRAVAAYPSNRFEALTGYRLGQYSIRINDQWRICFEWPDDETGPVNIEIVDYH